MAKLRQAAILQEDLEEFVKGQDDFRLEIATLRICNDYSLVTSHGGLYTDPVSGKTRQYDVQALDLQGPLRLGFAIECKSLSENFPLLVSTLPRQSTETYHDVIYVKKFPQGRFAPTPIPRRIQPSPLFPLGAQVGKSLVQVGRLENGTLTSSDAEVFDKWSQALNQAVGLIPDLVESAKPTDDHVQVFVLPILIVADNTLWTVDYSDTGQVLKPPSPTDEALYFLGRDYNILNGQMFGFSHLHIFTLAGFRKFLPIALRNALWTRQVVSADPA